METLYVFLKMSDYINNFNFCRLVTIVKSLQEKEANNSFLK